MLSGGMQQRTALARALANDPKILLLDEPFGALDNQTRSLMQELLLGIWESDRKTVLFVTHDIDEAIFMANRVAVMTARPGRIKRELATDLPHPRHYPLKPAPAAFARAPAAKTSGCSAIKPAVAAVTAAVSSSAVASRRRIARTPARRAAPVQAARGSSTSRTSGGMRRIPASTCSAEAAPAVVEASTTAAGSCSSITPGSSLGRPTTTRT